MLFTKNELLQALKNQILQHNLTTEIGIDEITIDSRKSVKNALFIALKGEINDGHNFIDKAFENGCKISLIDNKSAFKKHQNKNLILVKNTFHALYDLARFIRINSSAKIIAITGSAGKTGTKEMLKIAFETQGKTYSTIGNLNNHFGLPLTLCNMPRNTEFAIFEMGMNHLSEIEPLSKLAQPHITIITNITSAHIGNFNNEEEIALAKSEIFSGLEKEGIALIPRDNIHYNFLKKQALKQNIKEENILSFGKNEESNYYLQSFDIKGFSQSIIKSTTKYHGLISYEISSAHKATILNSLIVLACLDLVIKHDITKPLTSLKNIVATKGRGEIITKKINDKNIIIIDDSYNANLASMQAGIEYLSDLKKILNKKRTIAILGDMLELGKESGKIHEEVLRFTRDKSVDFILLAGQNMKIASKILNEKNYKSYLNSVELSADIKNFIQDGDILLIKGSRGLKMEEVLKNLN